MIAIIIAHVEVGKTKKILIIGILGIALLFAFILFGTADDDIAIDSAFNFSIGQTIEQLNHMDKPSSSVMDTTKLDSFKWNVRGRQANFIHGQYGFSIPDAMGVLAFTDKDFEQDGVYYYSVSINLAEEISQETARDKLYQFFADLQSRGWKPYYPFSFARIYGPKVWGDDKVLTLDVNAKPNMVEWMVRFGAMHYMLYADGVVLEFQVYRDPTTLEKPVGSYFMTMDVRSLDYAYRTEFDWYASRDKALLQNKTWISQQRASQEQFRKVEEYEALQRGLLIDRNYIDPVPKWAQP